MFGALEIRSLEANFPLSSTPLTQFRPCVAVEQKGEGKQITMFVSVGLVQILMPSQVGCGWMKLLGNTFA